MHVETTTTRGAAPHADGAGMRFNGPFGDGEAEAGAAAFPGAPLIGAVKAIEDTRLLGLGNSMPLVGDRDFRC